MTDKAISPLRRRMIEDMTIRKFASKTQHDYVQRVKHFAAFLRRSPDTASFEVDRYRRRAHPSPTADTEARFPRQSRGPLRLVPAAAASPTDRA